MIKWCKIVEVLDTQFLISKTTAKDGFCTMVEFLLAGEFYEYTYEHEDMATRDEHFDNFCDQTCKDLYISIQAEMN